MDKRENVRIDALQRIGEYGVKNAADWTPQGATPPSEAQAYVIDLFEQLNKPNTGVVAVLSTYAGEQVSGGSGFHGAVTSKSVLRDGINATLENWNRTAAAIATDQKRPEIMDGFRRPHGVSDEKLAAVALSFCDKAQPLSADFIRLFHPADFIQDLRDRVDDFRQAKDDKGSGLEDQVEAGANIDATIKDGLRIRKLLMVALGNLYLSDAGKAGAWATASHIERVGTSGKKKPKDGDNSGSSSTPPKA